MTVLVAGASGVFGRHLVPALSSAGHKVVSIGRSPRNDLIADLMDRESVLRAVDGQQADVVIHAATALRKLPLRESGMQPTNDLRIGGTKNLIAAAREVGARRFVSESMVFGYGFGDYGDTPVTEDMPVGGTGTGRGAAVSAAMRVKEELTFTTDGIDGVSLRYGFFYGAGATEPLVEMLRKRMLAAPRETGKMLPFIELSDAAAAAVAAVERGRAGQAYNIADDTPMSFGQHLDEVAAAFGVPRPMRVPRWLLRPMSYLYTALGTNIRLDTSKAARELDWRPVHPEPGPVLRELAG